MNRRFFRYHYLRFIRLEGAPKFIARGIMVGIFIGATPTLPFHTVLTLLFAILFRGSKIAAILACTFISNPFTFVPQYYLAWWFGSMLTPYNLSWSRIRHLVTVTSEHANMQETLKNLSQFGGDSIILMLTGGIVLALPLTIAGYFLSHSLFISIRKKRRQQIAVVKE